MSIGTADRSTRLSRQWRGVIREYADRLDVSEATPVVTLGEGGTPLIELYIVFNALHRILKGKNIGIARSLVGSYITSLEMAGCSITLVRLDDEMTKYWDAPVHTPALRWGV